MSKWLLLPTTHQIELVPYLALPILAAQPTTPALSASSSTIPLKNHGRQLIPHDAIVAFSDNNNGKEFSSVGARGEGAGVGGGVIGGSSGGSKQYSGLPNRIEESSEKNKLKKYEGASTVSVADNEEILGGSLSDNMLEEFYRTPMSFGTDNLTMVTTQVGATAFLPCRIHYIGDGVVSGVPDKSVPDSAGDGCWTERRDRRIIIYVGHRHPITPRSTTTTGMDGNTALMTMLNVPLQVSWIRRKDYHLLTVALTTYSSDERFSVKHLKTSEVSDSETLIGVVVDRVFVLWPIKSNTNPRVCHCFLSPIRPPPVRSQQDWALQMRYVQARDAGTYECQVGGGRNYLIPRIKLINVFV